MRAVMSSENQNIALNPRLALYRIVKVHIGASSDKYSSPTAEIAFGPVRAFALRLLGVDVDNRLDPVPLGIEFEGCIIAIAILRPRRSRAIATSTVG